MHFVNNLGKNPRRQIMRLGYLLKNVSKNEDKIYFLLIWNLPKKSSFQPIQKFNHLTIEISGSHPDHDSDFDEFSDGIFTPSDDKANSEDSGSTKNSGGPSHHVVTVTTGGGSGVNGFLSGSPGGEYSLLTSFLNYAHFRTSGYLLPVVWVIMLWGGGSGISSFLSWVNSFLSGFLRAEYSLLTNF